MYYYKECRECGFLQLIFANCASKEEAYAMKRYFTKTKADFYSDDECGQVIDDYHFCPECGAPLFHSDYASPSPGMFVAPFGTPEDYQKKLYENYISGIPEREEKYLRRKSEEHRRSQARAASLKNAASAPTSDSPAAETPRHGSSEPAEQDRTSLPVRIFSAIGHFLFILFIVYPIEVIKVLFTCLLDMLGAAPNMYYLGDGNWWYESNDDEDKK